MKKSEKKNYRTYGKSENISELIADVGDNRISNDQYIEYCELRGFCFPNRKKQKIEKKNRM